MKHCIEVIIAPWIPPEEPLDLFHSIAGNNFACLLHFENTIVMACRPLITFRSKGKHVTTQTRDGRVEKFRSDDALRQLQSRFESHCAPQTCVPRFQGGIVGLFGYDLVRTLEELPSIAMDDQKHPDILAGFYDCAYVHDLKGKSGYFAALRLPGESASSGKKKIETLKQALLSRRPQAASPQKPGKCGRFRSNFSRSGYIEAVKNVKKYIEQGDVYQVNLSHRFSAACTWDSYPLFRILFKTNPAPHAAFFHTPFLDLISLSPERFLFMEGRRVETRPIKGTRPRGNTPEEDRALRRSLRTSEKDSAELLMITDLERNDLGKVCEYGSVQVADLKRVEIHPTVFHLVSTVRGKLKSGMGHFDCLRSCFAGGSVTGAPKVRAMQIIEELEPTRRGIYTGSFGYLGVNGISDLSILIRTLALRGGRLSFQVGGGIVADSDPAAEYQETLDKARFVGSVLDI